MIAKRCISPGLDYMLRGHGLTIARPNDQRVSDFSLLSVHIENDLALCLFMMSIIDGLRLAEIKMTITVLPKGYGTVLI